MTLHRLLPVRGAVPKPGEDVSGTEWQQLMKRGETVLFCLDASGRLLKLNGHAPDIPIAEYCVAYTSGFRVRIVARGLVMKHPHMTCALYDKRGRWLETFTSGSVKQRNEGLRFARLLLEFPMAMLLGLVIIAALDVAIGLYSHTPLLRWELDRNSVPALMIAGLLVGGLVRGLIYLLRLGIIYWGAQPALAPLGSPKREKFYKRLNKRNLLTPEDITLSPAVVQWPHPERHATWTGVLQDQGFIHVGQYTISEAGADIDFWLHTEKGLTAAVSHVKTRGMWLAVWTQYPDGSSFGVANKDATGLDRHPQRRTLYIGPDQPAEEVLRQALALRPAGEYVRLTPEEVVPTYIRHWKEYIQWRRQRGTTVDEFKRIDERRLARMGKSR